MSKKKKNQKPKGRAVANDPEQNRGNPPPPPPPAQPTGGAGADDRAKERRAEVRELRVKEFDKLQEETKYRLAEIFKVEIGALAGTLGIVAWLCEYHVQNPILYWFPLVIWSLG